MGTNVCACESMKNRLEEVLHFFQHDWWALLYHPETSLQHPPLRTLLLPPPDFHLHQHPLLFTCSASRRRWPPLPIPGRIVIARVRGVVAGNCKVGAWSCSVC